MSVSTLTIVCDVLKTELNLAADQIWIYNQKQNIPKDSRLYVIVSLVDAKPYAAGKRYAYSTTVSSTTHQHVQETIRIDLLSADASAINRVQEITGAMSSDYAEEKSFANGLRISRIPISVVDTSAAEVTRMLFRMTVEFKALRAYTQTKTVNYYNDFDYQIKTEKGTI